MLIGSNNSLTYLEPSSWWFKIFKWFYRHQELPCDVQYTIWGVRMFDFRLYADKHNHIAAKNGKCIYLLSTLYETLDYFDTWVANWKKMGGQKVTDDVNEWYKSGKS